MSKDIISFDEWANKLASDLVMNIFNKVETDMVDMAPEALHKVYLLAIIKLIGGYSLKCLGQQVKDKKEKERFQKVCDNMAVAKVNIQNAISDGFQLAVRKFTQTDIEYYCVIKPVPTTVQKKDA